MNPLVLPLIYLFCYFLYTRVVAILMLNLVGLPGVLIGMKSLSRKEPRYVLGVLVSSLAHIYFHLAFMFYAILWTNANLQAEGFMKYLVWFFCMVLCVGSIQQIYANAKKQEKDVAPYLNPQVTALLVTEVISFFAFFLFVFRPEAADVLWGWVRGIPVNY